MIRLTISLPSFIFLALSASGSNDISGHRLGRKKCESKYSYCVHAFLNLHARVDPFQQLLLSAQILQGDTGMPVEMRNTILSKHMLNDEAPLPILVHYSRGMDTNTPSIV